LCNALANEREVNAFRTAFDLIAAPLWLKAAFRLPNVALRFAFNAAPRLTARFVLPWTANER